MSKATYAELTAELNAILTALERGDLDVDEAIKHYKRGQECLAELETQLKAAETTVEKINTSFDKA